MTTATLCVGSHSTACEAILSIAQRHWEGETSLNEALDEMEPYSPLALPERTARLGDLISELHYRQDVEDERIVPDPNQDRRTLDEAAERMVNEAVRELLGGVR